MTDEKSAQHLKTFSKITIETLKELAGKGTQLTTDTLFEGLSLRPEVADLMAGSPPANPVVGMGPPVSVETEKLKFQVETARSQREKLLKQLTDLEDQQTHSAAFYKRALLVLSELLQTEENRSLKEPLAQFKKAVKNDTDLHRIQEAFERLKDAAVKEGPGEGPGGRGMAAGKGKPVSLLARFLKGSEKEEGRLPEGSGYLDHLKEAYQEIINELRLNLDAKSLKQLLSIETRIRRLDGADALLSIRREILSLIHDYISRVSNEREQAATFIREIGTRLLEVEAHTLDSFSRARETHQDNANFAVKLESQLEEFKGNVDFSKTLSELKTTVVSSLSTIKSALEKKRKKDEARMAEVDKRMETLHKNLDSMKKEIVTAREQAKLLERELLIDPLTAIYNRRAYDRRIQEELQRYQRYRRPFSMLLFDVDHFKRINDQYGHAVGDICLKEIVKQIKRVLRESDFFARFGGEEFVVLLPETEGKGAMDVAEKLRQVIEGTEFLHKGEPMKITISIGVTEVEPSDESYETLFSRIDKAMYSAKKSGRNRVEMY